MYTKAGYQNQDLENLLAIALLQFCSIAEAGK